MPNFLAIRHYCITGLFLTILATTACEQNQRLPADVSLDSGKDILRKSLIAPLKSDISDSDDVLEKLPRRQLLQIQHSPSSLTNQDFIAYLDRRLSEAKRNALLAGINTESDFEQAEPKALSDAEKATITHQRAEQRGRELVDYGLRLEKRLFEDIRKIDAKIEPLLRDTVAGLGVSIPNFGRNLTEDRDGYLSIPADIVFVGGQNGSFASKTASIKGQLNNPIINFSVREMPLANAVDFLIKTIGLQAAMSEQIIDSDRLVTLSVEASVLAILDAVMAQHQLAILYDPSIEVAQIYADAELDRQLADIRAAIEGHNKALFDQKQLAMAQNDRKRLQDMIRFSQLLLGADDRGFVRGATRMSRAPAGPITSDALAFVTDQARIVESRMTQFDQRTQNMLVPRTGVGDGRFAASIHFASQNSLLIEDSCVEPAREIFTEKIAVYNAPISGNNGVIARVDNYFRLTRNMPRLEKQQSPPANIDTANPPSAANAPADPDQPDAEAQDADQNNTGSQTTTSTPTTATANTSQTTSMTTSQPITAPTTTQDGDFGFRGNCPDGDPAPKMPLMLEDDTGMVISGTRRDNDLLVKLVEQYDVPNLQVLIEIFMITVSKNFSREIDSMLKFTPPAGGNNISELTLSNLADSVSTSGGKFNLGFSTPNGDLTGLIKFLESNNLARLVSSPTILVADGETATISRTQTARVMRVEFTAKDNQTVRNELIDEYKAPFSLTISDVKINRINKTVRLQVKLEDTRFASLLAAVDRDTDETTDLIDTSFWSAPGDVVVLAGLTRNNEGTTTTGLPGTTGALAPVAPLLGGSDAINNALSETIIFMAPTVIDPSASTQPHSAFRRKPNRQ